MDRWDGFLTDLKGGFDTVLERLIDFVFYTGNFFK